MVKAVQAKMRETKEPDRARLRAELGRVELELGNVVDALAKLGTSGALLARVREFEAAKAALVGSLEARRGKVQQIAPNVEGRGKRGRVRGDSRRPMGGYKSWCPGEDLNLHECYPTGT